MGLWLTKVLFCCIVSRRDFIASLLPHTNYGETMFLFLQRLFPGLFGSTNGDAAKPSNGAKLASSQPPDNLILLDGFRRTEEAVEPQEPEPDFVLDDPPADGMGNWIASQLKNPTRPFRMNPEDAFTLLTEELIRRGMASAAIPRERFLQEWTDGIERTQMFMAADGVNGMMVRGCPVNPFTEVAEYIVKTAARNPPTALCRLPIGDRTISLLIALGKTCSIFEEKPQAIFDFGA